MTAKHNSSFDQSHIDVDHAEQVRSAASSNQSSEGAGRDEKVAPVTDAEAQLQDAMAGGVDAGSRGHDVAEGAGHAAEGAGHAAEGADHADGDPSADQADLQEQVAQLKDQLARTAADFDNFRKRSRRETDESVKKAIEQVLLELLPVFDNLERASAAARDATDTKAVSEGVGMVLRMFREAGNQLGLERVESVGRPFDPNMHDALQQEESEEHAPGTVVRELAPGYRLRDRLLRAAMVVVAKKPIGAAPQEGQADGQRTKISIKASAAHNAPSP